MKTKEITLAEIGSRIMFEIESIKSSISTFDLLLTPEQKKHDEYIKQKQKLLDRKEELNKELRNIVLMIAKDSEPDIKDVDKDIVEYFSKDGKKKSIKRKRKRKSLKLKKLNLKIRLNMNKGNLKWNKRKRNEKKKDKVN